MFTSSLLFLQDFPIRDRVRHLRNEVVDLCIREEVALGGFPSILQLARCCLSSRSLRMLLTASRPTGYMILAKAKLVPRP